MELPGDRSVLYLYDALLFLGQFLVGFVSIVATLALGLQEELEPLVHFTGQESIWLLFVPVAYFATIVVVLVAVAVFAFARSSDRTLRTRLRDAAGVGYPSDIPAGTAVGLSLVGAGVGAVAGWTMVHAIPDWLSTLLPSVALVATGLALLVAANAVDAPGLDTLLSTAGATIYAVLLPLAVFRLVGEWFPVRSALVGILFVGTVLAARWRLRTADRIASRIAVPLVVVLLLVGGGAFAYDLSGPRPAVTLEHTDRVDFAEIQRTSVYGTDTVIRRSTVRVGTLTVENGFRFARTATLPEYGACLYTGEGGPYPGSASLQETVLMLGEPDPDLGGVSRVREPRLPGDSTREFELLLVADSFDELTTEEIRGLGSVPVRTAGECPDSADGPVLVVYPVDRN